MGEKRSDVHVVVSLDFWSDESVLSQKKRQISALALGPLVSPYLLCSGDPDQAWPSPSTNHFSNNGSYLRIDVFLESATANRCACNNRPR